MKETQEVINPILMEYFNKWNTSSDLLMSLLQRRMKIPQLRCIISRLAFEIVWWLEWERIAPVIAAMEVQTMYLYLHNRIFDNKKNIWEWDISTIRNRINDITIAAAQTREVLFKIVQNFPTTPEIKCYLHEWFSNSIKSVYEGQILDINLTINRINEFSSDIDFLKLYEYKSTAQSWVAYAFSGEVWALLWWGTKEQQDVIVDICRTFGTWLHISNDLWDFSPPQTTKTTFGKAYQDQLSDIKENRLTYPIYYVLKNGTQEESWKLLKMVGSYNPDNDTLYNAIKCIHSSWAFNFIKIYIRWYYTKAKKKLHENFPKNTTRDLFSVMLSVIRSNKFLSELRKIWEQ